MTNLKFFEIKVKLMHKDNPDILACAEGNNLEVRAKLLYEDGNPVRTINPNDEPLRGDTEVWVIGGEARLKLRMGEKSLTSMGERKRFRIRIEPRDDAMRQAIIASLGDVDTVVVFGEDTPLQLLRALKPDVLVKGGDYTVDQVVGAEDVKGWGGDVVLADLLDGHSTTATIQRLGKK